MALRVTRESIGQSEDVYGRHRLPLHGSLVIPKYFVNFDYFR